MKSKVKLSAFCVVITLVVVVALMAGIVTSWDDKHDFFILLAIFVGVVGFGLFYCPVSIEATDSAVVIHRVLRSKVLPYEQISSVDRCLPSAGGLRLCGSGGFMGYWGYFSDIVIGTYFGYYGNRNQCVLIKLKDGKQYVVSCVAPDEMSAEIAAKL